MTRRPLGASVGRPGTTALAAGALVAAEGRGAGRLGRDGVAYCSGWGRRDEPGAAVADDADFRRGAVPIFWLRLPNPGRTVSGNQPGPFPTAPTRPPRSTTGPVRASEPNPRPPQQGRPPCRLETVSNFHHFPATAEAAGPLRARTLDLLALPSDLSSGNTPVGMVGPIALPTKFQQGSFQLILMACHKFVTMKYLWSDALFHGRFRQAYCLACVVMATSLVRQHSAGFGDFCYGKARERIWFLISIAKIAFHWLSTILLFHSSLLALFLRPMGEPTRRSGAGIATILLAMSVDEMAFPALKSFLGSLSSLLTTSGSIPFLLERSSQRQFWVLVVVPSREMITLRPSADALSARAKDRYCPAEVSGWMPTC